MNIFEKIRMNFKEFRWVFETVGGGEGDQMNFNERYCFLFYLFLYVLVLSFRRCILRFKGLFVFMSVSFGYDTGDRII